MCISLFCSTLLDDVRVRKTSFSRIPSSALYVCVRYRALAIIKFVALCRRCAGTRYSRTDIHRKCKRDIKNALNVNKLDEREGEHGDVRRDERKSKRNFHFVQNGIFSHLQAIPYRRILHRGVAVV